VDEQLDAGEFAPWLTDMQAALRGEQDADVPCNGCTACCTSSMFIHIEPDERDTLAHIPQQLLFPAPRRPHGHVVLGHDERGHCPMLIDNRCSIYEHRPRTCRTYDCRVFAATGIEVDAEDEAKVEIGRRVRRWQFDFADDADRARHDAVNAASMITEDRQGSATERAVLAIRRVVDQR
jgi:Fe-S-cluster containining protein